MRRLVGEPLLGWLRRAAWVALFGEGVGPFEMLLERDHPLVRAEMRRTRRKRKRAIAACVVFPLVLFTGLIIHRWLMMGQLYGVRAVLSVFVCAWPLAMVLGASMSVASSILAEMEDDTALQWVLTPIPARPLAAAKILSKAQPFLLGMAAGFPLYVWAGTCRALLVAGVVPSPLILWPLRIITMSGVWGEHPFGSSVHPAGLVLGTGMWLGDFLLVWVVTHWCAAEAICRRSLFGVALMLLARLAIACFLVAYGSLIAAVPLVLIGMAFSSSSSAHQAGPALLAAVIPIILIFLGICWWMPLRAAVNMAISAFMDFDDLALDP
ncbi:MAG: hypothetical protein ACYTGB_12800 [Planctomycetota bacterium]|jgi:hypothetical protein